jgi:hypothetical protein
MQIIIAAINDIKEKYSEVNHSSISDEMAFNHVALRYYYLTTKRFNIQDSIDFVTDGSNDGGIDFVYYDEEQNKVLLAQSKYTQQLDNSVIIEEFNKMSATVRAFQSGNTGAYNSKIKRELQNALDRLPDEDAGNVEYLLFTTAEVNVDNLLTAIERGEYDYSKDMITVFQQKDIVEKIQSAWEDLETVSEASIDIDEPNNYLEYSSDSTDGIMVNMSASSLRAIYNSNVDKGLFDLNIRRYIRNKVVDEGIRSTLNSDRDNFWFYNNGIIIACQDFRIDGNKVRIYNFSIVNGGQTTTLIGNYRGNNSQEFFIPCKIISTKKKNNPEFFNKIAETTNSQKPIYPRDLRSNAPEMRRLSNWLEMQQIYLEIKRGQKKPSGHFNYSIKNDELGQLVLSLVHQQPGTARSGKKAIFENNSIYNKLYKLNYANDVGKSSFLIDLVDLNDRYNTIEEKLKDELSLIEKDVLRNGKQIIFALLGVIYSLTNNDIQETDLVSNSDIVKTHAFVYAPVIGNYKEDDIDSLLKDIIICIVTILAESYEKSLDRGESTSISNFFKTDKKYHDYILSDFAKNYNRFQVGIDIKSKGKIFKRL